MILTPFRMDGVWDLKSGNMLPQTYNPTLGTKKLKPSGEEDPKKHLKNRNIKYSGIWRMSH